MLRVRSIAVMMWATQYNALPPEIQQKIPDALRDLRGF
jgi:hypothetical protein